MHRLRAGQLTVLAACVLASTACGSSTPSVDKGGFTAAERTSAQSALDHLQQTPIPRTIVAISYQTGAAPSTCVVLPNASSRSAFKLVVAWKPNRPDFMSVPQSVLEASMNVASSKKDVFHISSFGGGGHNPKPEPANIEADVVRANVSSIAERCEVLESGHLRLAVPQ